MASIKTSIELYDNFSDPMMDIVNAANAGTIAIENVQSAMNAGVDMSGINRATAAMQSFENTMQAIEAPSFSFGDVDTTLPDLGGATPNITVPVIPVVESQPQIDVPDGINVPVELSGVSESEKQIQDISTRLNNILNYQNAINNVGQNLFVMPGDSAAEITGINRELGRMQTALDYLKTNPFDLDSSVAQLQLGSLSSAIDNVIERQARLNDLMGNVPSQVYSATPTVQDAPQVEPTQAPVNVPFNWQADNMNVFDNTGIVSSAAGILDTIFGSDLQSAVQGFQDKIQTQINTTVENAGGDKPKTLDPSDYTMDRISYGDAFSMGADFGDGVVGGISDFFNKTFSMDSVAPSIDLSDYTAGIGDGVKDIAGNTGAIKNSLNVSEDELRYLRDIAEQEVINRFTTAEITINQSNENHITNGMDLDGVISALCDGVSEAIEVAAEGIHE